MFKFWIESEKQHMQLTTEKKQTQKQQLDWKSSAAEHIGLGRTLRFSLAG